MKNESIQGSQKKTHESSLGFISHYSLVSVIRPAIYILVEFLTGICHPSMLESKLIYISSLLGHRNPPIRDKVFSKLSVTSWYPSQCQGFTNTCGVKISRYSIWIIVWTYRLKDIAHPLGSFQRSYADLWNNMRRF